jgi:hypothetical protein
MGFRFSRRLRLGKGIWLNVSKSGTSLSLGGKGMTVNFGKKGTTTTVGLPGTGIAYRTTSKPRDQAAPRGRGDYPGQDMWIRWVLLAVLAFTAVVGVCAGFSQK